MNVQTKRPLMIGAAALGALALTLGSPLAASAHVTIGEESAVAGSYTVLTFGIPHGCEGSPTTGISIQIPEGINAVTPTRAANYTVDKVMENLTTPITDSHGNEVNERVSEVVYTALTPLPEGYRDAIELSLQVPKEKAGETLYFPTVQTCEEGESAWIEIPAVNQNPFELPLPAPFISVVAADSASGTEDVADTHAAEQPADQTPLIITSLIVGSLGLVAGAIALLRGRKKA
ncbi:YcnI family protein [Lysinibacter sp. HNR]|uniref:YcnI family copper-binding membrane protein n=1 Tax=Lysinibacter sp. HNR TaxID=3031408 RepID=UPI0024352052|nr:YcnI family protein [Lysinibacter sp. HNR]WGD36957.1 YcnI family protein [Lysinibacter sp. HNR]